MSNHYKNIVLEIAHKGITSSVSETTSQDVLQIDLEESRPKYRKPLIMMLETLLLRLTREDPISKGSLWPRRFHSSIT